MAKRIGKYKISKRESALSLEDGGTVTGNLTVTAAVTFSGLETITGSAYDSGRLFQTGSGYLAHTGVGAGGPAAKSGSFNVVCVQK